MLIESYITIPGFTLYKGFLQKNCTEGTRAFDSAWKELKECGYLIQYKMRQGSNRFYYEYELLDEPEVIAEESRSENRNHSDLLDPHFVGVENVDVQDVGVHGVSVQNVSVNNNIIKNNTLPNNTLSNHIISKAAIREQIGYDTFSTIQRPLVDCFVSLIEDMMETPDEKIVRVDGRGIEAWKVKERLEMLDMGCIEYVLEMLDEYRPNIKNPKAYYLTALYNAPVTIERYYHSRVARDMY